MSGKVSFAELKHADRVMALDYIIVLFCLVLIPSAVAHSLMGTDEKTTFALFAPITLIAILVANRHLLHRTVSGLVLMLLLTGTLASAVASSFNQTLMAAVLSVSIIVGQHVFVTLNKPKVLSAVSWFTLALLVGGIVGIAYSLLGGSPLLDLQVGYRTTYLFLTTFAFAFIGDYIRPSGIFDEPGSFAMYVAIVTMFNDTLRQNRKLNLALMVFLIFTGSLAGLALLFLYLVSSYSIRLSSKKSLTRISFLVLGLILLSTLAPRNLFIGAVDTFYSSRLQVEDGRFVGDNRSNQVSDFFRIVDDNILLRGSQNSEERYDTDDMSSNPFSIIYGQGLIISLPYFGLLLWLAVITMRNRFRNSYTSLGLIFLLLQRPHIYHMSWSILIAATVWLLYHESRKRRSRRGSP
jgi:hypothetical protein